MPHFFIILFKINLILVLFAATYHLVLRRLTFYTLNRIFLLTGILFSTVYPFINLTEFFNGFKSAPAFLPQLNQRVSQFAQQDSISVSWQVLTLIFYAGVLFMASRLVIQFISLHQVHKNSEPGWVEHFRVRILNDKLSPFSFWQTIYINPLLHKKEDLKNIIEHEHIHVKEWHTLDIVLAEISLVFYWFNPGVWLMKKAVKENIEFITDAKILKRGIDKKAYQYSLLGVGALQPSVAIVNHFNLSDLKKRIKMMNAKRSSKLNLTRYAFALPVLLIATLAFTIDKKDLQKHLTSNVEIIDALPDNKAKKVLSVPNQNRKAGKLTAIRNQFILNKNATFTIRNSVQQTDSSHHVLNIVLKDREAKIPSDVKRDREIFISSFIFNDSIAANAQKPNDRNIKIIMKTGKGINYSYSDGNNLVSDANVAGAGRQPEDSLSTPNKARHLFFIQSATYSVDGNKVSTADLSKLAVEQIKNIVVKQNGFVDIKTKQK